MIGTGVFTSVGFQLGTLHNTWTILILWISGGMLALFGAFAYAELGTHFSQSGGDYIYLSRIFHPVLGYLSAWAGLTVGFSAPVALAAMAFTQYLAPFHLQGNLWLAITVIVLAGVMHSFSVAHSSRFHNGFTAIKVLFIISLIFIGIVVPAHAPGALLFDNSWKHEVVSSGFVVSMMFVSFAYTGWNAAAYVAGEIDNISTNLPKALILSTVFVAVTYILFQLVLLKNGSVAQLENKEEVTSIAFSNLLGASGGRWVSIFIAIQLVATISSYIWVGPRVTKAMASEYRLWTILSKTNKHGVPVPAIWAHVLISIVLTMTGSFESVLLYSGFVLQLMASLTVAASLFVTDRAPGAFRSPFKPWLQVLFLLFNGAFLVLTFVTRPKESVLGLTILVAGAVLYALDRPVNKKD
jgi:APA family basic amino acid/polyamine antiporter